MSLPTWGIALTTNAPTQDVLTFCAHHLELGAHRIYLYLDDGNQETYAAAKAHPKLRPRLADAQNWIKRGTRPERHQERQIRNINHAYRFNPDVQWLWHIDVDEFLWPSNNIDVILNSVPSDVPAFHVLPLESMEPQDSKDARHFFRKPIPQDQDPYEILGIWGKFLPYGFLSHRQGKCAFRTGRTDCEILIHSAQLDDHSSWSYHISQIDVLHIHVKNEDDFIKHFSYRHSKGSYREELDSENINAQDSYNLHQFFNTIFDEAGEKGLRQFYRDFSTATPDMTETLRKAGLFLECRLGFEVKLRKHFPSQR